VRIRARTWYARAQQQFKQSELFELSELKLAKFFKLGSAVQCDTLP
jgi:hypothetical protein